MKILVAVNAPSRHLFPLFVEWLHMGHEVLAVVDRSVGRLGNAETFRQQGIEIRTLGHLAAAERSEGLSMRSLGRRLRHADAVVVGGYAARSARSVLTAPRRSRPHTVLLAERPDHRTTGARRAARDAAIQWAIGRTDAVWAMSASGKRFFEQRRADVPILAPYPLPLDASREDVFAKSCNNEALRVAVVGRLDSRKDPLMAAAALHSLHRRGGNFEATFYGDGPLREDLLSAINGIPARLAGHVRPEDVQSALRGSDVLLHTSLYDGWGMVVAEAVAAEVAVIAGNTTDAATELTRLGSTVRVVELDPETIAAELEKVSVERTLPSHWDALRSTRIAAEHSMGVETIAGLTIDDLERMVLV
jgi:glycosyltransferase involved in cell wall biosynthesis